ncbi:uncharacterized protein LOC143291214 [Babylonia areolata]|uniref:uncharacterized protein LOC143291214 n=1 Tax=Babylonia areolata TaxID=304850 RepID=UPI003FD1957D
MMYSAPLCLVVTLCLLSLGEGTSDKDKREERVCPDLMTEFSVCYGPLMALDDPNDLVQACQAGRSYVTCVEELMDRCEDDPVLQEDHAQAALLQSIAHVERECASVNNDCPNIMGDVNRCNQHVTTLQQAPSRAVMCQSIDAYLQCMEDLLDRCEGHPGLSDVEQPLGMLRDQREQLCSSGSSGGDDCPNIMEDAHRCNQHVSAMQQSSSRASMCRTLDTYMDCLDDLLDRCEGHPGLENVEEPLNMLRGQKERLCPGYKRRSMDETETERREQPFEAVLQTLTARDLMRRLTRIQKK